MAQNKLDISQKTYKIIRSYLGEDQSYPFECFVELAIRDGFVPLGAPFIHDHYIWQAMVKKDVLVYTNTNDVEAVNEIP